MGCRKTKRIRAMPIKKILLILIPIYIFFNLNLDGNYFTYKWVFFEIATSLILSIAIYKEFSSALGLTFFYFLTNNIVQGIFLKNPLHVLSILKGTITILFCGILLLVGKKLINKSISDVILILLIACCVQVFTGFPFAGLTGNTSLNATLISLMLPLCVPSLRKFYAGEYYAFLVCFVAIIYTGASLGLIALIVSSTVYLFLSSKTILKYFSLLIPLVSIPIMHFIYKNNAYSFSGRPDIWYSMWEYIKNNGNYLFGTGVGSGFYLIQKAILTYSKLRKELTPWGHNEILQVFFECGGVGVMLCAYSFIDFIRRAASNSNIFLVSFAISYLINCFGNFPHRLAPDTFIILTAIILAYDECGDSNTCDFKIST